MPILHKNIGLTVLAAVLPLLASTSQALDLSQAYQAAFVGDPQILAARANANAGREVVSQAKAQMLPNINASLSQNRNDLTSSQPDLAGRNSSTSSNYASNNTTVSLRQPIYRKAQMLGIEQAKASVVEVEASLETETQNLAVRVATVYFDAVLADVQLQLIKTQESTYAVQLDAARKLFTSGSGTRTDIDEVQARIDMAAAQRLEAEQNIAFTRRQLMAIVSMPVEELAGIVPARMQLMPLQPAELEAWAQRAEQNSPELRVYRARLDAARLEVSRAQSGHLPTLDLVAQLTHSASENTLNTQSTTDLRTLGLQLAIPIYSGGSVNSAVRQAMAAQVRAEQMLESIRRDISARVQREFRGVSEGVLRIKALEQAVRSADQAVQSSQKSFQAGTRTRLDILNAESNRLVVLRDLTQARHNYLLSKLRLLALVNGADQSAVDGLNQSLGLPT